MDDSQLLETRPMQFALFCSDSTAIPIIDALIARMDGHQISHVVQLPTPDMGASAIPRSTLPIDDWQNLLTAKV